MYHLTARITKRHTSCNTDLSAPIFLSNVHCLMGNVWCEVEQNWTKAVLKVIEQKPYLLLESQNDGHAEKQYTP